MFNFPVGLKFFKINHRGDRGEGDEEGAAAFRPSLSGPCSLSVPFVPVRAREPQEPHLVRLRGRVPRRRHVVTRVFEKQVFLRERARFQGSRGGGMEGGQLSWSPVGPSSRA